MSCGDARRAWAEQAGAIRGGSGAEGARAEKSFGKTGRSDYERYAAACYAGDGTERNRGNGEHAWHECSVERHNAGCGNGGTDGEGTFGRRDREEEGKD